MDKLEIIGNFKNVDIHRVLDMVLDDVENFEFEKVKRTRGFCINIWRVEPFADEGSYLYYKDEEARDHDWDLLMTLIEAAQ